MAKINYARINKMYQRFYSGLAGAPPNTNSFHFQHLVAKSLNKFVRHNVGSFDSNRTMSVLDVGCGSLPYKGISGANWIWVGLDIEDNSLADIKVATNDKTWDVSSGSFDLVLCTEVLEHSKYPESILSEVRRVLKPGGTLVLTTPFIYPIHGAPNDFRRYTPHFYEDNLTGFQIEILELNGGFGSAVSTLILNWVDYQCQKSEIYSAIRALFFPVWLIFSLTLNIVAGILDRLDKTNSLGTNILLVAHKI